MAHKFPSRIARIQLPPLPGSPGAAALDCIVSLNQAGLGAVKEALQLKAAGFDGLLVENWADFPHPDSRVSAITTASLAVILTAVRESVRISLGVRVFQDDHAALAVAAISNCDFIWAQNLTGDHAASLLRERARLGVDEISIISDAGKVKTRQDLAWSGADAFFFSGNESLPPSRVLESGLAVYLDAKVLSRITKPLSFVPTGVICGEILRKGGRPGEPLDSKRIRKTVDAMKASQKRKHGKARRTSS